MEGYHDLYAPATASRPGEPPVNGPGRTTTRRRGQSKAQAVLGLDSSNSNPPRAPDAPAYAPGSYKAPENNVSTLERRSTELSRSFSARARGLPVDQEVRKSERRYNEWATVHKEDLQPERRRNSRRTNDASYRQNEAPLPSTQLPSSYQPSQRRASDTTSAQRQAAPIPQPVRSSTLRDPTSPTSGEWSHRSPLQKLEGTLNDISKEEKRARVEEAEMLLRETKARRGSRRESRDVESVPASSQAPERRTSRRAPTVEPPRTADTNIAGVSGTRQQRESDRLSAAQDLQGSDARAISTDKSRGFDGSPASRHPEAVSRNPEARTRPVSYQPQPVPMQPQPTRTREVLGEKSMKGGDINQKSPASNNLGGVDRQSARYGPQRISNQLDSQASPSTTAAPVTSTSMQTESSGPQKVPQQPRPPQDYTEHRKSGPLHEVNSSHKAALAEAATLSAGTAAVVARSNSRKLQKAPPKSLETPQSIVKRKRWSPEDPEQIRDNSQNAPAAPQQERYYEDNPPPKPQLSLHKTRQHQTTMNETFGGDTRLGKDGDAAVESDEHHKHPHLSEMFHQRPRQQSVSFKEPTPTIRKLDEWRNGGVARLSEADFDLRDSSAEKDKTWWEGGGSGRRRSGAKDTERTRALETLEGRREGRREQSDAPVKSFQPPLYLQCGPLLRYSGLRREKVAKSNPRAPTERETWRGSVMIVTKDSQSSYEVPPTLRLFAQPMDLIPAPPAHIDDENGEKLAPEHVDPLAGLTKMSRTGQTLYVKPVEHLEEELDVSRIETDEGLFEDSPSFIDGEGGQILSDSKNRLKGVDGEIKGKYREIRGARLYADPSRNVTFWRFNLEVELGENQKRIAYTINRGPAIGFWVPARGQSMNIMFHSCNGFSLSVDPNNFSGPDPLWRDVLNTHQSRPFHVMIGGGDQIYNDAVSRQTTIFQDWLAIKNPHEKHSFPFSPELKNELESFYLERYCMWFSQGLFGMANSQIPMVNMWDDHDIIDGFGSYPHHFMSTPVFMGLGSVAFKYYMLFQHQSVSEETQADEPSWLLGAAPGPYIQEQSRSLFMYLGKGLAFLGLDCRTERMRDQILTDETYDIIFDRCRRELIEGDVKHLIILLGVPIAYPRLVWLENVLTSRAMDPIKAIGRMGMLGGFLNKFDGGVEILDDLDDHWTARNHKGERNWFIEELQDLAAEKSVRITILGGDVHLAAVGQFYSNPKLNIPKDRDHRYMPNIISSAIVNTPPPEMMGDVLNKRNKIHHLDEHTDEDMIPMFTHDVDGKPRNNKRLLPRRNWCSIREYHPGATPPPTPPPLSEPETPESQLSPPGKLARRFSLTRSNSGKLQRSFSFGRGEGKPRNIFRRLSQRGPPPSSWNPDLARNGNNWRPVSAGAVPAPSHQDGYFPAQPPTARASGGYGNGNVSGHVRTEGSNEGNEEEPGLPVRPGLFHRRPTNLSEKAVKKGVPAANLEINDHVNLEGGLDIVLNCEVSPKDPAGITTPYRLLVPALFYDGSSDLNHDQEHEHVKKKSWFGFVRSKRRSSIAANQGSGNWGGSESGSDEEDEEGPQYGQGYSGVEAYRQKPKRRWF